MKRWCARYFAMIAAVYALAGCGGSVAPSPKPVSASPGTSTSAATSSSVSPRADWQAEWDRLLASAKQEGQVNVATTAGSGPPAIFEPFKAKYGITINVTGQSASALLPKIQTERAAGQYLQDVSLNATNTTIVGYKPSGALDPLPAVLILPEVMDDKNWIGGFADGWADVGKNLDYSTGRLAEPIVHVNRRLVPESQLSHVEQLWDPAWKGKIVMGDTRVPSTATPMLAAWLLTFGEDKVRGFLQSQQPVISNQPRQMAEWVVRGQYGVGFGVGVPDMTYLSGQGVDLTHVKPLAPDEPGGVVADDGTGSVALFNRAPHPNAAKVLINWLLSQEGQVAVSKQTGYNSRRTDVPPVSPSTVIDPNKKYPRVQTEESYPIFLKAMEISKELLK